MHGLKCSKTSSTIVGTAKPIQPRFGVAFLRPNPMDSSTRIALTSRYFSSTYNLSY